MVHLPIQFFSGILGCWLFYVQHQYEDAYWEKHEGWDFAKAGLEGSSYYKLPKVLEWASGNIGFHHIHHLAHQIPNYNLAKCHQENPLFQNSKTFGIKESLHTIFLRFYDEESRRMITYPEYKKLMAASQAKPQQEGLEAQTQEGMGYNNSLVGG